MEHIKPFSRVLSLCNRINETTKTDEKFTLLKRTFLLLPSRWITGKISEIRLTLEGIESLYKSTLQDNPEIIEKELTLCSLALSEYCHKKRDAITYNWVCCNRS